MALAIAALAEAAHPYGIESFDNVLKPLWLGIRLHRGKGLAAFLKAIGFIIPLMDPEYASYYTKEVTVILIREFQTSDEEMKKIVLKVVKQCAATEGVTAEYIKQDIIPDFFKAFWVRRMSLDRRNYKQVVETTVELSQKAGVSVIVGRIVNDLKVCRFVFVVMLFSFAFAGRIRTIPQNGYGDDYERHSVAWGIRHRRTTRSSTDRWYHLFIPGANDGGPSHA